LTRAHYQSRILDTAGNVIVGAVVRVLNPNSTTPVSAPFFADGITTTPMANPYTSINGLVSFYMDVSARVRLGIKVGTAPEYFLEDVDVLVPTSTDISDLQTRATASESSITTLQSSTSSLNSRVTALEASSGGGGGSLAQLGVVALDSFAGANDDAKMAAALSYIGAQTYRPTLVLTNRLHTFNNSYALTIRGLRISGPLGGIEREFSNQCVAKVNGTSLFSVDPAATASAGAKDFSIRGICFTGNGSNYWLAPVTDLANGPILVDCNIRECGFVGFKTVMQARHLRVSMERTYTNNGTDTQYYLAGSDNNYFLEGHSYLSAVSIPATAFYLRFSHMSRTRVGGVYITPQVCGGVKVEGSYGDLYFISTKFDGTGRNTSSTWSQAPAITITGGVGVAIQSCEFFNTAVAGSGTKGIIQIQGGADHLVSDCTFIGGASQTSSTPTTRPAVYTTATCKVRGLTAPQGHQKILQQSTASLINNDDSSWTINTAA
jgi:hypothetical protein